MFRLFVQENVGVEVGVRSGSRRGVVVVQVVIVGGKVLDVFSCQDLCCLQVSN